MNDDDLKRLKDLADRATRPQWFARGRFISLVPDNSGMGATLHTNHIANFADRDDAEFVAAARSAVPALLAEVERLANLVQVSSDDINAVVDENDRMQRAFSEAVAKLKAGGSVRFSSCEWCGESWPKLDGCTAEEVEANARRHVYACKKHPMKAERDAARAEVARLRLSPSECEALQYARERLAATHNVKNVYIAESLAALDKVLAANGGE